MQRRAKAGGEIGANGERYAGGTFIATTDHPRGEPVEKKTRKVCIAPGEYVLAIAGRISIYNAYRAFVVFENGAMKFNGNTVALRYYGISRAELSTICNAFNDGKRFTDEV